MSLIHVCLSDRPNQLIRWQEAFPFGRIVTSREELDHLLIPDTVVWLHLDTLENGALETTISDVLKKSQQINLIAISSIPEPAKALECLQLGISGYCHALSAPAFFKKVATVVGSGGYWLGEALVQKLICSLGNQLPASGVEEAHTVLAPLSSREREVAIQVRQGAANKEIAEQLGITERTVKAHLTSIFQKLGIRDRLQLLMLLSKSDL